MKRVLVYCPSFLPEQTGYSHAFSGLIANLLSDGFRVDVLIPGEAPEEESMRHPGLRIFRRSFAMKVWGIGLFYEQFSLAQYIHTLDRLHGYDAVLVETGDHPLLVAFLRESLSHKVVVRFHSTSDTEYLHTGRHLKYRLRRLFWKFLAAPRIRNLCATNSYHLDYADERVIGGGAYHYRGVIVNTIDAAGQEAAGSAGSGRTFFMLGRMDREGYRQKGFDVLLEALPFTRHHFEETGSRLIIVGDGVCHEAFARRAEAYPFISLHRQLPHRQILELMRESDVILLPSLYEGVSMFALEALAAGKAVVFGNTGGLIGMVEGNGYLVEPGNSQQLAGAMISMMHEDLAGMKARSRSLAMSRFSSRNQLEQFRSMLKKLSA